MLQFIPVFFGATFLIFALVFAIPGDPIRALAGEKVMPQTVLDTLNERYNLDEPLWKLYGIYITNVFQGAGTDCDPNPCLEYACCGFEEACFVLDWQGCESVEGFWLLGSPTGEEPLL